MKHVAGGRIPRDQNPLAKEREIIRAELHDNNVRADRLHNMQVITDCPCHSAPSNATAPSC